MKAIQSFLSQLLVATFALLWTQISTAANMEVRTYFITDAVGSPVVATDVNANVTWREDYLPYGERRNRQVAAGDNERWFTGAVQNEDTGLISLHNRFYDPSLGRFLSIDPMGVSGDKAFTFNRYAYANNNPYRYIDPSGAGSEMFAGGPGDVAFNMYAAGAISRDQYFQIAKGQAIGMTVAASCLFGCEGLLYRAYGFLFGSTAPTVAAVITGELACGEACIGVNPTSALTARSAQTVSSASNAASSLRLELQLASEAQVAELMAGKGKPMAGAGMKRQIDDLARILQEYGGKASDWVKITSSPYKTKTGQILETHAYEDLDSSFIVEPKSVLK